MKLYEIIPDEIRGVDDIDFDKLDDEELSQFSDSLKSIAKQ